MIRIFYFFISTILVLHCFSQRDRKKTDSLLSELKKQKEHQVKCNILNELSKNYYMHNPEEGIKYAEKAFQLSTKINYKSGIANAYLNKGKNHSVLGNYNQSLKLYFKAKEIFTELKDNSGIGLSLLYSGNVYGNLGKFPDALSAFFNALRYFENSDHKKKNFYIATCYQNIGNIYNATENYDKALKNYDYAIKCFKEIPQEEQSTAMNIASKGLVYQKQNKNIQALDAYKTAEKILIPLKSKVPLAFVKSWMGATYLAFKEYDQSLQNSTEALKTIIEIGDQDLKASTLQNIGYAYLHKGMDENNAGFLELGYKNISDAHTIHTEINSFEGLIKDYFYISEYYSFKKDFKNSLQAYIKYAAYTDSIFNFKNKQSLQNLEDERTIELRDSEIKLNKLELEAKEKQKWLFILGLTLFAFIGILLFYQNRQRKKNNQRLQILNNELEQANKVKTQFFNILNHDLRSPVASLIGFMRLQKENPELLDEESKRRLESKTILSAENLLSSMEDILLWSKGQMENFRPHPTIIKVSSLFEDTKNHFISIENIKLVFEDPQNLELRSDIDYLKTIIRNLTANSIKALEQTANAEIIWKAWTENNKTYLSVKDNGPGATKEKFKALYNENETVGISTGLGLHLIRDLAKAINCKIIVQSNVGEGSKFILSFEKY